MSLEPIEILVNGEQRRVPPGASVDALLAFLELPLDRVAVELNKTLIRKRDWSATTISQGSQVEIVEFVGGG